MMYHFVIVTELVLIPDHNHVLVENTVSEYTISGPDSVRKLMTLFLSQLGQQTW